MIKNLKDKYFILLWFVFSCAISYIVGAVSMINIIVGMYAWVKIVFLVLIIAVAFFTVSLCYEKLDWKSYLHEGLFTEFHMTVVEKFNFSKTDKYLLLVIILIGAIIRILGFDWGGEIIQQPDEGKLVNPAIFMAQDDSLYQTYSIYYPDQFSSKIAAIVIYIFSKVSGVEIYFETMTQAYFIYRIIVALFGTATILVAFLIANYIRQNAGVVAAALVAIYPSFVNLSKQVSGDVTTMFFLSIVMLFMLVYLDNRNYYYLFFACMGAAMATMEKWHGAIGIGFIGVMLLFSSKNVKEYIFDGICAMGFYLLWVLIIAPNVIFNLKQAIVDGFINIAVYDDEVSPGFFNILLGYTKFGFVNIAGLTFIVLCIVGIFVLSLNAKKVNLILLMGPLKVIVLCFMNRYYLRWGLELYLCEIIVASISISWGLECVQKYVRCGTAFLTIGVALQFFSGTLLDIQVATNTDHDASVVQRDYCEKNGIGIENSFSDYYTGFHPSGWCDSKYGYTYAGMIETNWEEQFTCIGEQYYKNLAGLEYLIINKSLYYTDFVDGLISSGIPYIEFSTECGTVFADPIQSKDSGINDVCIVYENLRKMWHIHNGALTGTEIVIIDLRGVPALG